MQVREFNRRSHWKSHIEENSYQVDALTDSSIGYWVESQKENPFYVEFNEQEAELLETATERLSRMCVEYLDWFFTGEDEDVYSRMKKLGIPKAYWTAVWESWERTDPEDPSLYNRFDFAMSEGGFPKLLEINAETPLLSCETVYQWAWFCDMQNEFPNGSWQMNEYWELVAGRWRDIIQDYNLHETGISFLVDEELEEDTEAAMQHIQIIHDEVSPEIYCQIVGLRNELGLDANGRLVDDQNDVIGCLFKIYDWQDLQNDVENFDETEAFSNRLEHYDEAQIVIEPLWKQVLANKGSLAYIWEVFGNRQEYKDFLLETHFEDSLSIDATRLTMDTHVKKPFLGLEGAGVSIETGSPDIALEKHETFGYGKEGFIIQEYSPLPIANGYHYMIGSWDIDGDFGGVIIRGDKSAITGRYCTIIPHIVSDNLLVSL